MNKILKLLEPMPVMFYLFFIGILLICKDIIFLGILFSVFGGLNGGILLAKNLEKRMGKFY